MNSRTPPENKSKFTKLSGGYQRLSNTDDRAVDTEPTSNNSNPLQDAIDEIGLGKFHYWVFSVLGFRFFFNNLKQTLYALLEPRLKCYWRLSAYEGSFLTMAFFIGLMIGNTFMGIISDMFGRRKIMLLFAILESTVSLLSIFARSQYYFFLTQLAIGICHSALLVIWAYLAEVWPKDKRHHFSCLTLFQFFATLFGAVVGKLILKHLDWRYLIGIGEFTPLFLGTILVCSIPESPRSLFVFGKIKEADRVIQYIAKVNNTTKEIKSILTRANIDGKSGSNAREDCRGQISPSTRISNLKQALVDVSQRKYITKVVEISSLLFLSCCLHNFVLYISTEMRQVKLNTCRNPQLNSNTGLKNPYRCQVSGCYILKNPISWNLIGIAVGYLPGTLVVFLLLKYFTRRTALALAFMGIAFSLVPHYLCLSVLLQPPVFAVNTMFVTTAIKIVVVYSQESFPTRLRATAYSIAMAFGHIGNSIGALFSQALLFWNFTVSFTLMLAIVASASILLFISKKEPKNLALEDT